MAEASAQKAVALDPQSALAHRACLSFWNKKATLLMPRGSLRAIGLNGMMNVPAGHVASFTKTLGAAPTSL